MIGARTRARLEESLRAIEVSLGATELQQIELAAPPNAVAGERYPETAMGMLDSERKASRIRVRHDAATGKNLNPAIPEMHGIDIPAI